MRFTRPIITAAVAATLAVTSTPARADDLPPDPPPTCQISSAKVSPSAVVIGISRVRTVTVTATATGCQGSTGATVQFASVDVSGDMVPSATDPTTWSASVQVDPEALVNSDAGTSAGTVHLQSGEVLPLGADLTIKRAVSFRGFATSAKRVKKNKLVRVSSYIERADWNVGYYNTYARKLVRLQFRTTHGHFKTIKKIRSVDLGYEGSDVVTKVKMTRSGCFRFYSDATSTTASGVSTSVCVKVG